MKPGFFPVHGPLPFRKPRFSPTFYRFARTISGVYLALSEGIERVEFDGIERLVDEYRDFESGRSRLIIAFRHPAKNDPPLLGHVFANLLPKAAKRLGKPLSGPSFVHFLYGIGVPVWAGPAVGEILPRLAAIPVVNGSSDSRSARLIRDHLTDGQFPIALAPEGQVSYHSGKIGPLEPGVGRLGFWCRESLVAKGRTEDVRVLPLSIEYRLPRHAGRYLEEVLSTTEAMIGISRNEGMQAEERLTRILHALVTHAEDFYRRTFGLPDLDASGYEYAGNGFCFLSIGSASEMQRRIDRLCRTALASGERAHGLSGDGDFLARVFALRVAGWAHMFRNDFDRPERLSSVERSLAQRACDEAWLNSRHMELVDLLEYLDVRYLDHGASVERKIEFALNLHDFANRLLGGTIGGRYPFKRATATVRIGHAIDVAAYEPLYKESRRTGITELTNAVRTAFESLIVDDGELPMHRHVNTSGKDSFDE